MAFLTDDPRDEPYVSSLAKYAACVKHCKISPWKKIWLLPNLLQGRSISVDYFYSSALQVEIDALLEDEAIDYVFCSSSQTAEYLFRSKHWNGKLRHISKFIDMIDMDSYKWVQYADHKPWPQSWVYRTEGKNLLCHEKKIAANFERIIFVSDLEKSLFIAKVFQNVPQDNVLAIGNGVDLDFFSPAYISKVRKDSPVLIFYGAMDYWPNIQAVVWFANNIFPLIQQHVASVKFYIAGSNPSHDVRVLGKRRGIEVTGFVDDIRDYIALADVCVMPLRIARGIQNKVLEAMAMGKPVVCSPEAHEGIDAEDGVELFLAVSPDDFAAKTIELLADGPLRNAVGERARSCMEKKYAWAEKLSALERLFD